MEIAVVGLGTVGLVVAACWADAGHRVRAFDEDLSKVESARRGVPPFYEPGLAELCQRGAESGRLRFESTLDAAIELCQVAFLAAGTPPGPDGAPDLSGLVRAADGIARSARGPLLVASKSTAPVGTCEMLEARMRARCPHALEVVANPEFLAQGRAIADFSRPCRVVIGSESSNAVERLAKLYAPLLSASGGRMLTMDRRSAELAKYAANAALALRVSMINEHARLATALGADVDQLRAVLASDPRIGPRYLEPGLGFGGSCLPKDLTALRRQAEAVRLELPLVEAAERVNRHQRGWALEQLDAELGGSLSGRRVALWGLAFKPGSDDLRESAAVQTAEELLRQGAAVAAYDPVATDVGRARFGEQIAFASGAMAALEGADALLITTGWPQFRELGLAEIARRLRRPLVIDGCNLFDPRAAAAAGLYYLSVGRPRYEPLRRLPSG